MQLHIVGLLFCYFGIVLLAGWSPDCGGVVSYIAKDADEEVC